tara:strand:+ start:1139 stop:2566 length:1428 start_codon:yes stop_codon:yes gene_type:complete
MPNGTRQPAALPVLFLTEMWERFGFYVVQGLLVLYMTQHYEYSDSKSYSILGAFTALAYISPIIGGKLADRLLGFTTAVIWGGLILVLGYGLLAIPSNGILFFPGLATIIIGTGMFKPCISSLLGEQYQKEDPRREAGFTIFYIGINMGAFISGISSGYIKDAFGWHIGFMLASIGLLIGLATFMLGLRYIKNVHTHPKITLRTALQLILYGLLATIGITFLLQVSALSDWVLPGFGVLLVAYLAWLTLQQTAVYRKSMAMLNILLLSSIVFWMMYFQMFFSVNLFISRLVDRTLFGVPLSTTVFYAAESIFIITLGPLFAWSWHTLGRKNQNPETISKFILGTFFAGLGFLILSIGTQYPSAEGLVYPIWVFLAYLLITIGELFISPIGLSAVTMLAPPKLVGFMMGVWFVATGFGGMFAGALARIASVPDTAITTAEKLAVYHTAFLDYAGIAFFVSIALFFSQFLVKKFILR